MPWLSKSQRNGGQGAKAGVKTSDQREKRHCLPSVNHLSDAENCFTLLGPKDSAEKSTFLSGSGKISRLEDKGIVEWISLALTELWSDYVDVDISRAEFSMERTPR
jgi:hypothetical protein